MSRIISTNKLKKRIEERIKETQESEKEAIETRNSNKELMYFQATLELQGVLFWIDLYSIDIEEE